MRIALLFILSTFFALSANAQIVNIPDANFKNALLNHNPVINTNNDGEIQVSEAVAFTGSINLFNKNIADLTGINAFVNLRELYCYYNRLTALNINGLNSLTILNCAQNQITSLTINNLPTLQALGCSNNLLTSLQLSNLPQLQQLQCGQNKFTSLSLSGFPSMRWINTQNCDSLATLTVSNMPNLGFLDCGYCNLSTLTMAGLNGLDTLYCYGNKLTSLTLSNPAVLQSLSANNNQLTALPTGLSALQNLAVENNKISVFALDNLNSLKTVRMFNNLCTSLTLNNKPQLISIYCYNNLINNLQLSNLFSLRELYCYQNQITSLNLNGFSSLESVRCYNNQLTSLTLTNVPQMKDFMCHNNQLTTLSISNMPLLKWIQCQNNKLTNFSLNNVPALYEIFCDNNQLTSLPFLNSITLPSLRSITFSGNRVPRLIVENHPILQQIICDTNPIDSLRLKNLPNLSWFRIEKTPLKSLKLDSLPKLRVLYCGKSDSLRNVSLKLPALEQFFCDSSKIVSADLSQTKVTQCVVPHNPLLQYINLRNNTLGDLFYTNYNFSDNQSLHFVCADDSEKVRIMDSVSRQLPGQGTIVSTVCNYIPSANSTIRGTLRMDYDLNGCNNADSAMMNVKLNNSDGSLHTSTFTNNAGQYTFYTLANTDTVKVVFQNPSWFNVSPPQQVINIPNPGITAIANFCVSPVGNHPDVDISIIAITRARPGVDATYRIVYSNKGNTLQSGTFYINFNTSKLSFVSATVTPVSQSGNTINWNYVNLYPFQTRSVEVTFRVAIPPIANGGDVLTFSGTINPVNGDETPGDNHTRFVQTIVNSYDPNDKEVGEGSTIDISEAGDYLHYTIHFQNEGSADAIKVLIKDSLTNNLNWNSFVPMAASHSFTANMPKGNVVEFVFDNINLPPKSVNEAASQGFVAFKVKPKTTITVGETINNKAEIYFDFNQPVITNTVSTTIVSPEKSDNLIDLSVYSNPVKDEIRFTVKAGSKIRAINLYNVIGEKLYSETVTTSGTDRKVNVANLPTGILFLQVITNGGTAVQKVTRLK
jgi:uncharacterized repeat protein (TIGR01451 family)